jgi:hypothetical protein
VGFCLNSVRMTFDGNLDVLQKGVHLDVDPVD